MVNISPETLPPTVGKLLSYIETQQLSNDSAHRMDHIRNVIGNCVRIFDEIECRRDVVLMAACLHDLVPRAGLAIAAEAPNRSASAVGTILKSFGISQTVSEEVAECIRTSAWEFSVDGGTPTNTESYVLRDADLLEAIGARGIARVFSFAGSHDLPLGSPHPEFTGNESHTQTKSGLDKTPFQHIHRKLLRVRSLMHSKTAKTEAENRHAFLLDFLSQYESELEWSCGWAKKSDISTGNS